MVPAEWFVLPCHLMRHCEEPQDMGSGEEGRMPQAEGAVAVLRDVAISYDLAMSWRGVGCGMGRGAVAISRTKERELSDG